VSSEYGIAIINPSSPIFPHFSRTHESGIIAIGGSVDPSTLLEAYSHGIFPWYNDDFPVWWNPDPRFVLFPDELKVSKSMRPYFNQNKFSITYNTAFDTVIKYCMHTPRPGQGGTWLNEELVDSFNELHRLGYAHSVEVWNRDKVLVGGLYGMAMGKVFFGESMFSHESNASKFGFISLVKKLMSIGIELIDCQQETGHLASMGARSISREQFVSDLKTLEADTQTKIILH
jgi:leucyl/phenylalanyl-tRNA--protein transferase